MRGEKGKKERPPELDLDDTILISELFQDRVVERLKKLHARSGVVTCSFAGPKYKNWLLEFRSAGSGFEVVGFRFDERAEEMGLDL
jgi:hypothetical protein